jgi:hypothetical protein
VYFSLVVGSIYVMGQPLLLDVPLEGLPPPARVGEMAFGHPDLGPLPRGIWPRA